MTDVPKPLPRTKIRTRLVEIADNENFGYEAGTLRIQSPRIHVVPSELPESGKSEHILPSNKSERGNEIKSESSSESACHVTPKRRPESVPQPVSERTVSELRKKFTVNNTAEKNLKREDTFITVSEVKENSETISDSKTVDEILKRKASIQESLQNDERSGSAKSEHSDVATSEKSERTVISAITEKDSQLSEAAEDLLGIHIHRSDCLKIDRVLKHPSVTVHIVDSENNGLYLQKSKPNKNVTYNQERSSFILPVMTRPFNFRDNKSIIPEWNETLTFNESTSYIIKPSTILFFEIVDFIDPLTSNADYASVGWQRIAWAFLKPFGKNNILNVEKMVRLQLYYAHDKTTPSAFNNPCVYKWYRSKNWKLYPSTLYVTVKSISSGKVDSRPQQRSCTPLQPEIGSDASVKSLGLFSSDGEDISDSKGFENLSALNRLSEIEWSRLPGQSCRIPNLKIASLYPDSKGCIAIKFSNSGLILACGTCNDVFIYAVDGILERRLISHQGLIYTLCWFTDDSLLLSSSADCTACIWDLKSSNEIPLQILPHPSFVYCSTFVFPESSIATGCYDGIVRVWVQTHAFSKLWQLHQELAGHEEYVNSVCAFRSKEFFSGDSVGIIIHWTVDEYGRWYKLNTIKLSEISGIIINKLISFPGCKRLLIHTRDSLLRTMDIKTSVVIQWYQGGLNDSSQCSSAITPCGNYIYSVSEDGTINVWESNTGKQVAFYSCGSLVSGCGGMIDYHPHDHICAFSLYSVGYSSSSITLLKYCNNAPKSDVMLYLLNESDDSNYGRV